MITSVWQPKLMARLEGTGRHMAMVRHPAILLVQAILELLEKISLLSTSTQGQSKATHSQQVKTLSPPVQ